MNRLTDNDRNFGPFTLARWKGVISVSLSSGHEESGGEAINTLTFIAFGWALRIRLPKIIEPLRIRHEANWDEQTVARLGRNHYFETHNRRFGISLSDMGNGYDFLQIHFGPQTHDSSTTKDWCCHLPWKQWRCVRSSVYRPDGTWYDSEERGTNRMDFRQWMDTREACPKTHFAIEDYDGEKIIATCTIEEREWHRGDGWFKWLKWFYPAKIRRSLDLKFNSEVGPEKGSWKGGMTGHGIDMLPGETPQQAFERYCSKEHNARHGRKYRIRFIGPSDAPPPRVRPTEETSEVVNSQAVSPGTE